MAGAIRLLATVLVIGVAACGGGGTTCVDSFDCAFGQACRDAKCVIVNCSSADECFQEIEICADSSVAGAGNDQRVCTAPCSVFHKCPVGQVCRNQICWDSAGDVPDATDDATDDVPDDVPDDVTRDTPPLVDTDSIVLDGQLPDSIDRPDSTDPFVDVQLELSADSNCVGLDDCMAGGVFVAPDGLDEDNVVGDFRHPFNTIGAAIAFAASKSPIPKVFVAGGMYKEQVNLVDGVSLYGGYDPSDGWKRKVAENPSRISFSSNYASETIAVNAVGIMSPTVFDGFVVVAGQSPVASSSSYGMYVLNCTRDLVISNNSIQGGSGTSGINGISGESGPGGGGGEKGSDAFEYDKCGLCTCTTFDYNTYMKPGAGGSSPCGMNGGKGGAGGKLDSSGADGERAANGGGYGGAGGPEAVASGTEGGRGSNGFNGRNGQYGQSIGSLTPSGFYSPSCGGDGDFGGHGQGGGGGGGGGGDGSGSMGLECYAAGGAGGGGGGGGCGGAPGYGGGGGGGSFGLFVLDSSPEIHGNNLISGFGGNGGFGGSGGFGGPGGVAGAGGAVAVEVAGAGASGGKGADGGDGGHGGGGGGGPSFALFIIGELSEPLCRDNKFQGGQGGEGGLSGDGVTRAERGLSGQIYGMTADCSNP